MNLLVEKDIFEKRVKTDLKKILVSILVTLSKEVIILSQKKLIRTIHCPIPQNSTSMDSPHTGSKWENYTVFTMKCEFIVMDLAAFRTYLIRKNTFKFTYCQGHLHFLSLLTCINHFWTAVTIHLQLCISTFREIWAKIYAF